MASDTHTPGGPRWSDLYETAAAQEGHFTTAQAAEAGYYPQLLTKYLNNGKMIRVRRGIYRLVHFLVIIWLWSKRCGVFSHETALALHQLSDALPAKVYLPNALGCVEIEPIPGTSWRGPPLLRPRRHRPGVGRCCPGHGASANGD